MQSGVTTAYAEPPLSVCTRLRTGSYSSDRKVRLCSTPPLSIHPPHLSILPPIHLHPPCPLRTQLLQHPPLCLPTSLHSTFNHISFIFLPSCLSQDFLSSFLPNFFKIYSSSKNARPMLTPLSFPPTPSFSRKVSTSYMFSQILGNWSWIFLFI